MYLLLQCIFSVFRSQQTKICRQQFISRQMGFQEQYFEGECRVVYYQDSGRMEQILEFSEFARFDVKYCNIRHEYKFCILTCFREPYDQNPVLISTLSVIKCRHAPMDLVRVETTSQVCVFLSTLWGQLGILSVQEQRNVWISSPVIVTFRRFMLLTVCFGYLNFILVFMLFVLGTALIKISL